MIGRLKRWKQRARQIKRLAQWCIDALGNLETAQGKLCEAERLLQGRGRGRDRDQPVTLPANEYRSILSVIEDSRTVMGLFIGKIKQIKERLEAL